MKPEEIKTLMDAEMADKIKEVTDTLTYIYESKFKEVSDLSSKVISELQSTIDQQNAEIEGFREHIKETFNSKESECESLRNNLTQVMNQKIEALESQLTEANQRGEKLLNDIKFAHSQFAVYGYRGLAIEKIIEAYESTKVK